MSPKELMYVEDVLGHAQQMKSACSDFANQLKDAELKGFVKELSAKHQQAFDTFFSLLNS